MNSKHGNSKDQAWAACSSGALDSNLAARPMKTDLSAMSFRGTIKHLRGIPAFLREYKAIPCNIYGISWKWNICIKKKNLLQDACREMSTSRVSTWGECRWLRADASVHLHNRACAAVTCVHAPRDSQLLLPSCSFPDMRPAKNSFSWYKSSIFDWFPKNLQGISLVFPQQGWDFLGIF